MTIRSLLEYVGAVERGQKITVNGREVDRPGPADRLRLRVRSFGDRMVCPGCIRLKISPVHLLFRITGLCDGKGAWT